MKNESKTTEAKRETVEILREANKILLVSHLQPNGDSLGSLLALKAGLTGLGKNVFAVCGSSVPKNLEFLPNVSQLSKQLTGTRDLIIDIKTDKTKIETMRYDSKDGLLRVIITPKEGEFSHEDIKFDKGVFQFDAIVTLDTPDVASLDDAYDEYPELFHDTPVINIDHHDSNELYGTVNLVDGEASSTSEMLLALLESLDITLDKEMAECLLTGLIADTHSFKSGKTTAKTLSTAATLIGAGADQAKIVENLYGTKPTSQLKIWGRVLARLEEDEELDLVYSSLTYQDFLDCKASPDQMKGIVDELLSHSNAALILLLIERQPGVISVRLRSTKSELALQIAKQFHGSGTQTAAGFDLENIKIGEATKEVLRVIRETLTPRIQPMVKKEEVKVSEKIFRPEPKKTERSIRPEIDSNVEPITPTTNETKKQNRPRLSPVFDDDEFISEPKKPAAGEARTGRPNMNVWPTLDDDDEDNLDD